MSRQFHRTGTHKYGIQLDRGCQPLEPHDMDWTEDFDHSLLDEEALRFLIEYELQGTPAAGITEQVIARGLGSLSPKQLAVFKTYIVDEWLTRKCKNGNHEVEGHELIGLWMDGELCGRCADRWQKEGL